MKQYGRKKEVNNASMFIRIIYLIEAGKFAWASGRNVFNGIFTTFHWRFPRQTLWPLRLMIGFCRRFSVARVDIVLSKCIVVLCPIAM